MNDPEVGVCPSLIFGHHKWFIFPPRIVDDPVLWVNRDHNKCANYLYNVAMDRKRSWRKERRIDLPTEYHWFAVSDGVHVYIALPAVGL